MPKQTAMDTQYLFPVGIGMVSSALKTSGRNVQTLNLTYKENSDETLRYTIIENNIDVLATGGLSGEYVQIRQIIDIAKTVNPKIIIIIGGGIITAEPVVAMKAFEIADYGIIGEGEITINALAYALETGEAPSSVNGIVFYDGSEFQITPKQKEISNLDCLPYSDYDGFEFNLLLEKKHLGPVGGLGTGAMIATSRSCPYSCTFCFHTNGNKYRRRSLDNVFAEIEWLRSKYNFEHIHILDELFGRDYDWVAEFCQRIKPMHIKFTISIRVDMVSNSLLHMLHDSGCIVVGFGVEHIHESILRSMKKNITKEQIETAFQLAKNNNLHALGGIIIGDVNETADTAKEAIKWWRDNRSYSITLNQLLVFPGSQVYKDAVRLGFIIDEVQYLKDGCPALNITKMDEKTFTQIMSEMAWHRSIYEDPNNDVDPDRLPHALNRLSEKYTVCIWPAVYDNINFFSQFSADFWGKVFLVNLLPEQSMLQGVFEKFGKKIFTPDIIDKQAIQVVICPRHAKLAQIRELCKNYLSVINVVTIPQLINWAEHGFL
jgi:radical SAM superfamily enzyme YgiQ (UPF0313 family)